MSGHIRPCDLVPLGAVVQCAYCYINLVLEEQPPLGSPAAEAFDNIWDHDSLRANFEFATVDHVIPRSRGGLDTMENVAPSCWPCNSSKGRKTLDEWLGVA